jgi:hypothetical protein
MEGISAERNSLVALSSTPQCEAVRGKQVLSDSDRIISEENIG